MSDDLLGHVRCGEEVFSRNIVASQGRQMVTKDLLGHSRRGEEVFNRNIVASHRQVTLGVLPTSGCILE